MRRHLAATIVAAVTVLATVARADPIEGVWQTQPDEGALAHVTIAPCADAFCGVISRTYRDGVAFRSPGQGRQIVIDMMPRGGGDYTGKVWRPANDKIYSGKVALTGDRMKLSGCVAGGLICKSQTWVRVP